MKNKNITYALKLREMRGNKRYIDSFKQLIDRLLSSDTNTLINTAKKSELAAHAIFSIYSAAELNKHLTRAELLSIVGAHERLSHDWLDRDYIGNSFSSEELKEFCTPHSSVAMHVLSEYDVLAHDLILLAMIHFEVAKEILQTDLYKQLSHAQIERICSKYKVLQNIADTLPQDSNATTRLASSLRQAEETPEQTSRPLRARHLFNHDDEGSSSSPPPKRIKLG